MEPVDPRSAWSIKQDEVDKFLNDAFSANPRESTGAYIVAPHASGKSTSLLVHVVVTAVKAGAGPIFYALPYYPEANALLHHLEDIKWPRRCGVKTILWDNVDQEVKAFPKEALVLATYAKFPWNKVPKKCVIMADVEIFCTFDGELFFSRLFHRLGQKDHAVTALCLDTRLSSRTIAGFHKRVPDCNMTVIEVPDNNPDIPTTVLDRDRFPDFVRYGIRAHVMNGGFAIAHVGEDLAPAPGNFIDSPANMGKDGKFSHILQESADGEQMAISINPGLGAAGVVRQLTLSVGQSMYTAKHYDPGTSRLAPETVPLPAIAIKQQEAWVRKAEDVSRVRRVVEASKRRFPPALLDPRGPAWNQDLMRLLMALVVEYEGVHISEWPIRRPPDVSMAGEAMRRLAMMGCVEQRGGHNGGIFHATPRGRTTLAVISELEQADDNSAATFEASYLFALSLESQSPQVGRVIALMALITNLPFPGIQIVAEDALDQVRADLTLGVGKEYFGRGWLWMSVGFVLHMWRHKFLAPQMTEKPEGQQPDIQWVQHSAICNAGSAMAVFRAWKDLGKPFNLAGCNDLVAGTQLTEPEVDEVDWALLRAFQTQSAMIMPEHPGGRSRKVPMAADLLTDRGANFPPRENLDVARWRSENQKYGSFVTIFKEESPPDTRGEPLEIRKLTYIGRKHCIRLARENDQAFPWCLQTTFPIQY